MKDKPVFPITLTNLSDMEGITLREYAAIKAMQALLASQTKDWNFHEEKGCAEIAVKNADALIEELNKPPQPSTK